MKKNFILISLIFIILFSVQDCFSQSGWLVSNLSNNEYFYSIDFIDENTGFLINSNGVVYVSVNKGVNWNNYLTLSDARPFSAYFFDFYNYVIVGTIPGYFAGWVVLINSTVQTHYYFTSNMTYLVFPTTDWIDINTGYVGGYDFGPGGSAGRVFRTTNKGTNWTEISPPGYNFYVYSLKFLNVNTGYVLSYYLFKTTNMGDNWTSLHNAAMSHTTRDMSVINEDTIYLAGGPDKIIMTTNGGINWIFRNPGMNIAVNKIRFINSKTGWICGDGGLIMKTTNAGINWQNQYTGTTKSIRDLYVLNENYLWASGDSGVVLRTTTGGATFINNNTIEKPEKYELYQNYPNPFNSMTNVKFEILNAEMVEIKVFDLSGKEVRTLVNEYKQAGTYEVSFDAEGLSSGIYFYKMTAGEFSDVKRMVLLK
jgi:hypothetical protein